jgi:hypothetical protein
MQPSGMNDGVDSNQSLSRYICTRSVAADMRGRRWRPVKAQDFVPERQPNENGTADAAGGTCEQDSHQ